ncbi:hypothetical protein MmiAt1_13380 [Methanimicrococcus sp. At1]|uniref:Uncharacterized protein n=1 Tax=Methanimicrococcus hacksteinii TaxID=3028293 RepID=A0ABU3VQQ6_9EURY|nr:hypothetical protein [Methanimicrococcus sp. At1]MDV0445744.1 hypothetical protein [Methanimicrococcus sp. At1]
MSFKQITVFLAILFIFLSFAGSAAALSADFGRLSADDSTSVSGPINGSIFDPAEIIKSPPTVLFLVLAGLAVAIIAYFMLLKY